MNSLTPVSRCVLFALFVPIALGAATYIVPPDADLIRSADAIAIVHVQSTRSYRTPDGSIATDVTAVVERALKSPMHPGTEITITQRGGVVGDVGLRVTSEPRFAAGERALLMLERAQGDRFRTISGELGKFGSDREIFGWELSGRAHIERVRDETLFVRYIERVVAGENPPADYFVSDDARLRPDNHVASGHEYLSDGARWEEMGFTLVNKNNEGAEDGGTVAQNAAAIWNGAPDADIDIDYGGVNAAGVFMVDDGENNILFDQSAVEYPVLAGSVAGVAAYWFGGQHQYRSVNYASMADCDVIVETGFSSPLLISITGHELGHCLGFRHSNQPAGGQVTSTSNALMNSVVDFDFSLRQWDQDAASHVYGDGGGSCTPPSINTHPASIAITEGNTTTLTVTAAGTSLSYQWYVGASGTTTTPTGGNTPSLLVGPSSTTSYWVRVTGACGSVDSTTAIVTVNPGVCVPPAILNHPASRSIFDGQTTTLSVTASGSGLSYQWFIGASGDTSSPAGTNSSTLTIAPSSTTSYWVRVTGACGSPADSEAATVTVTPCPEVTVGTPVATKQANGSYVLTVAASSEGRPVTIHWFRGTTPGTAGTFLGSTASLAVPAPTGPVSYWVLAENDCRESAVSPLVTISNCELPAITTQPVDQAIASGASATLSVAFAPPIVATVTWYRGTAPDKSNPAGTGLTFNTGALTAPASFFAAIANTCGEVLTRTATISISCTKPAVNQPANQTVTHGKSATITVTATGSGPLTYQWYEGPLGVTLFPVGTSSATLVTKPLTSPAQYWVLVKNACGEAFTQTIRIDVNIPKRRSTRH